MVDNSRNYSYGFFEIHKVYQELEQIGVQLSPQLACRPRRPI